MPLNQPLRRASRCAREPLNLPADFAFHRGCVGSAVRGLTLALGVFSFAALGDPSPAHAQATQAEIEQARKDADGLFSSRFAIDDQDPERSVIPSETERNASPIDFGYFLMNLSERADEASKHGDHVKAAKYYNTLSNAVPENGVGFSKACVEYEKAGLPDLGARSCAEALSREGVTLADYQRYVRLALATPGKLPQKTVADVDAVVQHLDASPGTKLAGATAACALALRLDDEPRLERCTAILRQGAANDSQTLAYEWALALKRHDQAEMTRVVERARHSNMTPAAQQRLAELTREEGSLRHRLLEHGKPWLIAMGGLTVAMLLLLAMFSRMRRLPKRASV